MIFKILFHKKNKILLININRFHFMINKYSLKQIKKILFNKII